VAGRAFTALAVRSLLRLVRNPQPLVVTVAFPLVFVAVSEASFGQATRFMPGFGTRSYLQFAVSGMLVLSAMATGINTGAQLAYDLNAGLVDRILLAPSGREVLLAGAAAGPVVLVSAQTVAYLIILSLAGTPFASGPGGAVALVLLVAAVGATFCAVGITVALRTGSPQVVLASFPAFFILMTFSSFLLPLDMIRARWFRVIAKVNPISWFIDAGRSLAVDGWRSGVLVEGGTAVLVSLALAALAAERALQQRSRGEQ
jgi:ABC-2 type transport system permease protein